MLNRDVELCAEESLTETLRRLVGTPEMTPVLWRLKDGELTDLAGDAVIVRDAKRRLAAEQGRFPLVSLERLETVARRLDLTG